MKNILQILKELGVEVPAEKESALNAAVAENYKTVADYGKQKENNRHNVVCPLRKMLKQGGFYTGEPDKSAGKLFDAAVRTYQGRIVGLKNPDGEFTAKGRLWRKIPGI